jgi:hypothetical protein
LKSERREPARERREPALLGGASPVAKIESHVRGRCVMKLSPNRREVQSERSVAGPRKLGEECRECIEVLVGAKDAI